MDVALSMSLPLLASEAILTAALVEGGLYNQGNPVVPESWADADVMGKDLTAMGLSVGLLQQILSWGSKDPEKNVSSRMDCMQAALNFFKRLIKVPGWELMSPAEAATRVQNP
jgi:hypothetical protein